MSSSKPRRLLLLSRVITHHDPISQLHPSTPSHHLPQLHAHLLTTSSPHLPTLATTLALTGHVAYSRLLLLRSPSPPIPSLFSLNALLRAHPSLAFLLVRTSPFPPDHRSFTFLARASPDCFPAAPAVVHGAVVRRGFVGDGFVGSALVCVYAAVGEVWAARRVFGEMERPDLVCRTAMVGACAEGGDVEGAREVFDGMPERDCVAWNAMIAGYEHAGRSREALELFRLMQSEGVPVNEATFVSVLSACAHLGAAAQGKWAHVFVQRSGLRLTVTLGTALIDMYSKCGDMVRAMEVFWEMKDRNVYTWSSAMNGLTMNGAGEKCLELFELMRRERERVSPNAVTFVSVLRGCGMAGLVEKAQEYFNLMRNFYEIEPWLEHYGCLVDLYGRAGRLDDALGVIKMMPFEPHVGAWMALLHSCRIHGNKELGELALNKIVELEARHDGAHVLLSNIYAESRNWDGVSKVRDLMKAKGVKKEPGCSVIDVGGEVHEFFVGAKFHPRYREIEAMLGEIARRLRFAGYTEKTKEVLFDIEEEEKVDALGLHSEKLAIALGLLSSGEGEVIRIVKNLRVCSDCHDYTKFVSKVFDREIVVRDRNRFHHFRDGTCSCKDRW